ncbi:TolC family outer membrane protein [Thauera sinica]|uniref:TolC family outer membrane protein n=1 Tax=Thauera sinica TaxID=2665146 RepID=A0ABW1AQ23_9RHOO|nr:TolC family outer membrane protein [Thauera sp. K11]ATE62231.1 channel protein TolC [Thauera sp. K11]
MRGTAHSALSRGAAWRAAAAALGLAALLPAPPAAALDLLDSYRLALQNDARHQASRAQAAASREAVPQARAQLLPSVSASLTRSRNSTEREAPDVFGRTATDSFDYVSSNYALTLRQPVLRMYGFAQYRQARHQVEGAEATLDRSLQDLLVRLAGAYFDALLAQDQHALVIAQKEAYAAQLEASKRAFAAGQGTRTDIDDAQARYDLTLAQELEASQNLGYTRRQLQTIIDRPVDALAALDPARMELQPPQPADAEEWIARGEEVNPELRALRADIEVARQELDKARAGHYPTVDLVAQRSRSESENNVSIDTRYLTTLVGVQVNVPLFAGGYTVSQTRQALAGIERAEQQYEARRREVGQEIRKEFQNVAEGVLRVRALEQAERSAGQAVFSNQKGFQAGTRSRIDILDAQQQRVSVKRDLAVARYRYIVSRLRLQSLVGTLDEPGIEAVNAWLAPPAGRAPEN